MEYTTENWSEYDDLILEIMLDKKVNLYEISIVLRRTLFEVQNRIIQRKLNKIGHIY